jgi:hypothetical protein
MRNAELDIIPPVTLEQLIGKGQDLPSLPEIYLRVSEQLEDENSSVQQIGDTVQNDPAISTRVLKMVNSAYYGLPNQVSSIAQAVSLLGRERLKHILIGSVLRGVFSGNDNPAFSMQVFWQHSIKTAIIARQLARHTPQIGEPEAMFTAGLLHDIGNKVSRAHVDGRGIHDPETDRYPERRAAAGRGYPYSCRRSADGALGAAAIAGRLRHPSSRNGARRAASFRHPPGLSRQQAQRVREYVPPLDDQETQDILDDIDNWDQGNLSFEQIASACQHADEMVFEVMESLGMITIEISDD